MTIDSDDSVLLPKPPPPQPAARRTAIDAAMRKFDGLEPETPARKPYWAGWMPKDRRAFGAFATAAILAIVSVPVALTTLRNDPPPPLPQASEPPAQPQAEQTIPRQGDTPATAENVPAPTDTIVAPPEERLRQAPTALVPRPDQGRASADILSESLDASSAPAITPTAPAPSAPPPPPPPPPPAAERESRYADAAEGSIVVTGSRVGHNELAKQRSAPAAEGGVSVSASSVEAQTDFFRQMQAAFRANDRQSIISLAELPLRVRVDGRTVTYRTAQDIERDFDEIFTPRVKQSVLNQRADGAGRVRFGPTSPNGPIRIREVRP